MTQALYAHINNKIILKKKKPNATDSRDMDKKKKKGKSQP
jgi:hypothetical protein